MRAGWIGTASDFSSGLYFADQSGTIALISSIHFARRVARWLVDLAEHLDQHGLGVAEHAGLQRIIAAERLRLDVDLDRRRADLRHRPEMRGHAAGLGADEADEIGAR